MKLLTQDKKMVIDLDKADTIGLSGEWLYATIGGMTYAIAHYPTPERAREAFQTLCLTCGVTVMAEK